MSNPEYPKNVLLDDRFRTIADAAPVMIWMSGADKNLHFFNKGWLDFTGRTLEQESGQGWTQGVHPEDYERCVGSYVARFDAHEPFEIEYRLRRHDGNYRWIRDKGVPRYETDGSFAGYIGSCMDVHDSRTLNELLEEKVAFRTEKLREQKEFSDTVFNASIDVMIVYGKHLEFLALNDAAKKMYRITDDVIGKKVVDVFPKAKDSQGIAEVARALKGETIHNEMYFSEIASVYYENFMIPLKKAGEVYAVLVIARDISNRIKSENKLKQLNEKLTSQNSDLQSSNEDLESFNYIASHDLQEPLRKVNMFAGRILDKDGNNLSDQSKDYFDRLTSATTRMQALIQSLLEYSRMNSDDIKFVKTNLNKTLKEVRSGLDEVIKEKNATIESGDLPSISVVPLQFQQLLHNLVSNALKYSKQDLAPVIRISAEKVTLPEKGSREFWKISVSDNGIGFDPEYKHKIFELFQRLHGKMEYEGTGIGLAICRKIANIHHGFITADGKPGEGSVFNVHIPVKI
ncbi:sensor histidine kinase [Flavobacterium selenitireducens]|uniref:sensor histidine kinase n=1 Tax=Flavobacterium selenitireducens TaxID=2722704 RepID=UPI00168B952F|nr:PAS domain S-box protein [Flavobacterium selenitireducens]MBD3581357.1 PAS domain S-box protein [Flavobacterium selenitireducens]